MSTHDNHIQQAKDAKIPLTGWTCNHSDARILFYDAGKDAFGCTLCDQEWLPVKLITNPEISCNGLNVRDHIKALEARNKVLEKEAAVMIKALNGVCEQTKPDTFLFRLANKALSSLS